MPAPQSQDARRGKLVQGLLWGGVGLAPLSILILLFGQSTGSLRVAVILSVLTIVMLAVSIALKPGIEMVRVDIEHRVLDEMERVRLHTRDDISTASRNTHRALVERIQVLNSVVEDLRGQVDEVHAVAMLPPASAVPSHQGPGGPGLVRRTETVHVTRRTMLVGGEEDGTGTVYGSPVVASSGPAVEGEWRERRDEPVRRAEPIRDEHRRDERGYAEHGYEDRGYDDRGDRHVADRHAPDRHGPERHGPDRHASERYPDDRPGVDRHDERHRDDRSHDDRHSDDRHSDDRHRRDDSIERHGQGRGEWDGMATGDRWASVRADENGRELRVGERRSSVRSDGRGTEMRVEDRWASLRRDEPPDRRDGAYGEAEWESTFRSLSQRPDGPRALPAAPGESPSRYVEDRSQDGRARDNYEPVRSRGRERARGQAPEENRDRGYDGGRGDDRGSDRGHDDRHRDDRGRDDRGHGYDDRGAGQRGSDRRGQDYHAQDHRGPEHRGYDDRSQGDRGYDDRARDDRARDDQARDDQARDDRARDSRGRDDRSRDHSGQYGARDHGGPDYSGQEYGGGHDDRRYAERDDRSYAPRPRSGHPSEYDR
jgi:hypothetical protein